MASERRRWALHHDLEKESIIEAQERILIRTVVPQSTRRCHRRIRPQRHDSTSEGGRATFGISCISFYANLALLCGTAGITTDTAYQDISSVRRTSRNLRTLQKQMSTVISTMNAFENTNINNNNESSGIFPPTFRETPQEASNSLHNFAHTINLLDRSGYNTAHGSQPTCWQFVNATHEVAIIDNINNLPLLSDFSEENSADASGTNGFDFFLPNPLVNDFAWEQERVHTVRTLSYVSIAAASLVILCLVFQAVKHRENPILQLSQGIFLISFLLSALMATASTFLLRPEIDLYCRLGSAFVLLSVQLMYAVIAGRLWRSNGVIGSLLVEHTRKKTKWACRFVGAKERGSRGSSKKGGLGYAPSLMLGLVVFVSIACPSKQGHRLAAFSTMGVVEGFAPSAANTGLAAVQTRTILPTERASSLLFVHTPQQVRPNVDSSTHKNKRAASESTSSSPNISLKTVPPKTNSKSKAPKKKRRKRKQRRLTFSVMFERLKAYQKTHGHCLVAVDDPDPELYKWTRSIRKNYKHQFTQQVRAKKKSNAVKPKNKSTAGGHKTRRPMLSESKVAQLQSVDFCWDVQGALWDQRYQDLAECYEIHGSTAPLSLVHAIDPGLAIWMQNQRRDYRLYLQDLPTPLTNERLELLEDLGVVEDFQTQQEAWAQHYQYLVEFDQKHGHVNVPQKYSHSVVINVVDADGEVQQRETTFALGQWCMNQRTARRRWDSLQQAQKEVTDEMKAPKIKKEKITKAKSKAKKNERSSLGGSGGDARNIISAFRIRMLDALDFAWNERDTKWQHMLGRLKEYYQTHGHLKIPTSDAANQDLRNWLIFQRHYFQRQQQRHQSSPMTATRVESMEGAIPDFSWKAHEGDGGPSTKDWSNLFTAMRDKGIAPDVRPKQHWFEGVNPFSADVKSEWSEQELVDLWHQEGADDDEEDDELGDDFKQNDFYVNWEDAESGAEEKTAVPPGWEIDDRP